MMSMICFVFRFLYLYNSDTEYILAVQKIMSEYVINGVVTPEESSLLDLLSSLDSHAEYDLHQQFDIFSHVSNNHWRQFVTVFGVQSSSTTHSHLNLVCHMSVSDKMGSLPASARNRLIRFLVDSNTFQARRIIEEIRKYEQSVRGSTENCDDFTDENMVQIPPPPKRARRVVTVTSTMLAKDIAENLYIYPASSRSNFCEFRERVVLEGVFYWRFHSSEEDIFVVNDYCPETGTFLPFVFVHVRRTMNGESAMYTCSCKIYIWLQQKAMSGACDSDDIILDGVTCMHCRFMTEEFESKAKSFMDETLPANSSINSKLIAAKCSLNHGVVLLSPPSSTTYKFSVCSKSGNGLPCSFVHLSKDCAFIFCLSGECRSRRGSKKKVQYLVTDSREVQAGVLCEHLEIMRANSNLWKHLYNSSSCAGAGDVSEMENEDDTGLVPAPTGSVSRVRCLNVHFVILIAFFMECLT